MCVCVCVCVCVVCVVCGVCGVCVCVCVCLCTCIRVCVFHTPMIRSYSLRFQCALVGILGSNLSWQIQIRLTCKHY